MPRARKPSDELVNKRKRVQRVIKSLQKSLNAPLPSSERKTRRKFIRTLESELKKTYVGRIINKEQRMLRISEANKRLDKLTQTAGKLKGSRAKGSEKRRSMELFKIQLRTAAHGEHSGLGLSDRELRDIEAQKGRINAVSGRDKVNIFFRYTQNLWDRPSVPREQRIEAIYEAFNSGNERYSMEDIWDLVMRENRKAISRASDLRSGEYEIEDDMNFDSGSPIYLLAVNPDVIR